MIAYVETRLELDGDIGAPFLRYVASHPHDSSPAVAEVFVRHSVFEGDPPKEIILTVTPA